MQKLILIIIGLFLMNLARSQTASPELISSSGNNYSTPVYQLNWSLGEIVIATQNGGSYMLTQGFQQDNYVITEVKEIDDIGIRVSVYPNPTTDIITLNLSNATFSNHKMWVTITDMNGSTLIHEQIKEQSMLLNFLKFSTGIYSLTINQETQVIKRFKIIKK